MTRKIDNYERGNTLIVTISVVATILALLGAAVSYTEHISRSAQRSRKAALAMEIADGHLEYLFASWRNIYRTCQTAYDIGGTDFALLPTNYFYTASYSASPAPSPIPSVTPAAPPPAILLPPTSDFPTGQNYTVTQYRIQAVDPMITLDQGKAYGTDSERALKEVSFGSGNIDPNTGAPTTGFQPIPAGSPAPAAYGPNSWQYSFYYLAAADVSVPTMTGSVTAKVRRIFEKRFDNPWTYALFYVDDLELQPTYAMSINGPIHTNGNLYIGTSNVTTTDTVKYGGAYLNGYSPLDGQHQGGSSAPNLATTPTLQSPFLPFGWNLNLNNADSSTNNDSYHEILEVPASGTDPLAYVRMYNQAGIKVLVDSSNNVTYYNAAGNVVTTSSSGSNDKAIAQLLNSVITKNVALWDVRENTYVRTVNVDVGVLTTAINNGTIKGFNGVLYVGDTTTNGTTVTSKLGGTTNSVNTTERAVRLVNGATLPSGYTGSSSSLNNAAGLTVVSVNPVYIQGNYNTGSGTVPSNNGTYTDPDASGYTRKGAAIMGDAINVLSGAWSDVNSPLGIGNRAATATTVNAALVGGIVPSGTTSGNYSGGGENFIRFLEDWTNNNFTYYGSLIEMFKSTQATGLWSGAGNSYKQANMHIYYDDVTFSSYYTNPPGKLIIAAYLQQQRWYQVY